MLQQWCESHKSLVYKGTKQSQLYIFFHGYDSNPIEAYQAHTPNIISNLSKWTLIFPTTSTGRWWEYKKSSVFNNNESSSFLKQNIVNLDLELFNKDDTNLFLYKMISTIKDLLNEYTIILSGISQGGTLSLHLGSHLNGYKNFRGVFSHNGYIDPDLSIVRSENIIKIGYVTGYITEIDNIDDHCDIFTSHSLRRSTRFNNFVKPFRLTFGSEHIFLKYLHKNKLSPYFILFNSLNDQIIPFFKIAIPSLEYL
jgi:predicted esterase